MVAFSEGFLMWEGIEWSEWNSFVSVCSVAMDTDEEMK